MDAKGSEEADTPAKEEMNKHGMWPKEDIPNHRPREVEAKDHDQEDRHRTIVARGTKRCK